MKKCACWMEKCWFEVISTPRNTPRAIILVCIYFFAIIHISRNKHIKFIVICEIFLKNIELHNANHAFKFTLQKSMDLFSPIKSYSEQMTQTYEMIYNKMTTMHKELKQQKQILEACKKCSKNRRIALQEKFVFMMEAMLQITKETKSINVNKNALKWPRKFPIQAILDKEKKRIK